LHVYCILECSWMICGCDGWFESHHLEIKW
jgi:hypothetical protein